jgi:hypothetical protein
MIGIGSESFPIPICIIKCILNIETTPKSRQDI